MARNRRIGRRVGEEESSEAVEEAAVVEESDVTEAPVEEPAVEVPVPANVIPIDREPRITLHAFARGRADAIMKAFAQSERLSHTHTRKQTRAQWQAEFEAFLKEPR